MHVVSVTSTADNQGEIAESGLIQLLLDRLRQLDAVGEENAALVCEVVFSVVFENGTVGCTEIV
jgi:hypothetical protein